MEVCVRPGDGGRNTWEPTGEPYDYYECAVDDDDDDQGDDDRTGRGRRR